MLYILLIIIAIGVLLASTAGQELLKVLFILALIAGGAYLGFWIVVILWGLFSDKDIRDSILTIIGTIMLAGYAGYGLYIAYKRLKTKEKRIEAWKGFKSEVKKFFIETWKEHKAGFIFAVVLVLIIIFCWIILPIYFS